MGDAKQKTAVFTMPEIKPGDWARNVRLSRRMSQVELARRCGVSPREVDSFEKNRPVRPEVKLRLLQELWADRWS